ncbi:MAG: hypothetical protein IIB02_04410, partial [Thaumarchaeota archaeon]|nr:hypothetical protein [Nitrososphaerota archaeon]
MVSIVLPLIIIIVGLNRKKIKLKNLSLKSIKRKKTVGSSFESQTSESSDESIDAMVSGSINSGNSEIESLLAAAPTEKSTDGNSEIESLLAAAPTEKSTDGNSEIESLLAAAPTEKSTDGNSE